MVILARFFIKVWGFLPCFFSGGDEDGMSLISLSESYLTKKTHVSFGPHWWGLPPILNGVCLHIRMKDGTSSRSSTWNRNFESSSLHPWQITWNKITKIWFRWFSCAFLGDFQLRKEIRGVSGWLFFSWTGFPTTYFASISTWPLLKATLVDEILRLESLTSKTPTKSWHVYLGET